MARIILSTLPFAQRCTPGTALLRYRRAKFQKCYTVAFIKVSPPPRLERNIR